MAFCSSKLLAKAPYTILSHGYVCSVGHTNAAPRWPCLWGGLAHPIAASPPLQRTPPVRGGLERQTQVTKIDDHFFMTSPFLFNCSPSSMMVKLITCEFSLTFHIPFFPLVLKYQLLYLKCVSRSVMSDSLGPCGSPAHGILLEWVAMPSSKESSRPKNRSRCPTLQADSLMSEAPGKSHLLY